MAFRAGCELFGLSTARATGLVSLLLLLATPDRAQSTQQFKLNALGRLTNGSFAFGLSAPPGRTYVVDASTNLAAWKPLITNIAPNTTVVVVDTNAAQLRYRSYRGRLYWTFIVPNTYASWQTTTSGSGRQLS